MNNYINGSRVDEIDANTFAMELLMPEKYLRQYLKDHHFDIHDNFALKVHAEHFGVEPQVLALRIQSLGGIAV